MNEEEAFAITQAMSTCKGGSTYTYSTEHGHTVYFVEDGHERFENAQLTPLGWFIESLMRTGPKGKKRWVVVGRTYMPEGEMLRKERERMPK